MSISVTEKSNKQGYLKPIAVGALTGYSAKWLIPVASWEKNEFYSDYISMVKKHSKIVKDEYISSLRESGQISKFVEKFSKHLSLKNIKWINSNTRAKVLNTVFEANDVARTVRVQGYKNGNFLLKRIRPGFTFAILGASVCAIYRAGQNILSKNQQAKAKTK